MSSSNWRTIINDFDIEANIIQESDKYRRLPQFSNTSTILKSFSCNKKKIENDLAYNYEMRKRELDFIFREYFEALEALKESYQKSLLINNYVYETKILYLKLKEGKSQEEILYSSLENFNEYKIGIPTNSLPIGYQFASMDVVLKVRIEESLISNKNIFGGVQLLGVSKILVDGKKINLPEKFFEENIVYYNQRFIKKFIDIEKCDITEGKIQWRQNNIYEIKTIYTINFSFFTGKDINFL